VAVLAHERIHYGVEMAFLASCMRQEIALEERHECIAFRLWFAAADTARMLRERSAKR
jgi:hypothetical protein